MRRGDSAHIYIHHNVPGVTAESALLFLPSEAVFTELHEFHPEVVEEAHASRVWITSPTTMSACLMTMRGVLKEANTRPRTLEVVATEVSASEVTC